MYCQFCKTSPEEGATHCAECGADFTFAPPTDKKKSPATITHDHRQNPAMQYFSVNNWLDQTGMNRDMKDRIRKQEKDRILSRKKQGKSRKSKTPPEIQIYVAEKGGKDCHRRLG